MGSYQKKKKKGKLLWSEQEETNNHSSKWMEVGEDEGKSLKYYPDFLWTSLFLGSEPGIIIISIHSSKMSKAFLSLVRVGGS